MAQPPLSFSEALNVSSPHTDERSFWFVADRRFLYHGLRGLLRRISTALRSIAGVRDSRMTFKPLSLFFV